MLVGLFKQISFERIQSKKNHCSSIHINAIWRKKCDLTADERAFNRMWQMIKYCYEKAAKFDVDEWPNAWPKVELLPLQKFYGDYPFYSSQHQYIIKWMAAASAMHFPRRGRTTQKCPMFCCYNCNFQTKNRLINRRTTKVINQCPNETVS